MATTTGQNMSGNVKKGVIGAAVGGGAGWTVAHFAKWGKKGKTWSILAGVLVGGLIGYRQPAS